tara:strand:+ start:25393 stop:25590 length:198 start_codon:yes stop_codon:yes gene_type:complete
MRQKKIFFKVIIWRIISITSMLLTLWALTGDLVASTNVTVIVQMIQTVIHTIFESIWERKKLKNG